MSTDTEERVLPDFSDLRAGSLTLLAQNLSKNVDQLGGLTLIELAEVYGISPGRMRSVIHAARRPLRRKGIVVCVPIRDEDFVYIFTMELATYLLHYGHRMDARMTEDEKVDQDIKTLNNGVSLMDDVMAAQWDFADRVHDIILEALQGAEAPEVSGVTP
jgi:hypothetical protein